MKIQTNAGEVELTPEMVRPGMVFDGDDGANRVTVADGSCSRAAQVEAAFALQLQFLGCDPAIADRADCERYGVVPGIDAGAHGFARLRGGGAVDLRRPQSIVAGMAFTNDVGERYIAGRMVRDRAWARAGANGDCDRADLTQWRFIGLDTHHARPEDVERLCCGVSKHREFRINRVACTLAIGHDGEHEDIAMGAKWGSEADAPTPIAPKWTRSVCGLEWATTANFYCTVRPVRTGWAWEVASFDGEALYSGERSRSEDAKADAITRATTAGPQPCKGCAGTIVCACRPNVVTLQRGGAPEALPPARILFRDSSAAVNDHATLHPDGTFTCACGSTDPAEHREGCALPWWYRMSATWAVHHTNARGEGLARVTAEGLLGAAAVALLAWCCRAWDERPNTPKGFNPPGTYHCLGCDEKVRHGTPHDCAAEMEQRQRREREAPLVALVNAVPAGLDANGWRAAVLATIEVHSASIVTQWVADGSLRQWVIDAIAGRVHDAAAQTAYARAIAPQGPRSAPFRRRAPGLPVDMGDE